MRDLPPYVVKDQDITLEELENGSVTVFANLQAACQNLYHNVAGPNILLDSPDFPDFSSAIEHSVNTEGCIAYNLLIQKVPYSPGHSLKDTYLRITIGSDLVSLFIHTYCKAIYSFIFTEKGVISRYPLRPRNMAGGSPKSHTRSWRCMRSYQGF